MDGTHLGNRTFRYTKIQTLSSHEAIKKAAYPRCFLLLASLNTISHSLQNSVADHLSFLQPNHVYLSQTPVTSD